MTTQPDAAMTRERALEEAAVNELARVLMTEFQRVEPKHTISQNPTSWWATFADMARAALASPALASTRQEPAPAADAEEVDIEICAPNLVDEIAARIANRLAPEFGLTADGMADVYGICQEEMAALRRYAGDGVTKGKTK